MNQIKTEMLVRERILIVGNADGEIARIIEVFATNNGQDAGGLYSSECLSSALRDTLPRVNLCSYDISICRRDDEAVDAVARSLAEGRQFSVAFVYGSMIGERDGPNVAQRILAVDPTLNIVLTTDSGSGSVEEIATGISAPQNVLFCPISAQPSEIRHIAGVLSAKSAAERRLQETSSRFHQLLTSTPVIIYSRFVDKLNSFTYVGENISEQFGYDPERFLREPSFWLDRVHPDDQAMVTEKLKSLSERGQLAIEYRFQKTDGEYLWVCDRMRGLWNDQIRAHEIVGCWLNITERKQAEDRIRYLAFFDDLTGLPNRAFMKEMLEHSISNAQRYNRRMAVLFLDIDHFKRINDNLGHDAGDSLLREVAKRLASCVRDSDTIYRPNNEMAKVAQTTETHAVSRLGGDEFVVVLAQVDGPDEVATAARRIGAALSAPLTIGTDEVSMAASVGISVYPDDGTDSATLLKNADAALYFAKENGRNGFQFFTKTLNERTAKRYSIESKLKKALDRNEFTLHYQPVINLQNDTIIGTEALIRWKQADGTLMAPTEFIPIAEESGLIVPIGEWVLQEACRQTAAWRADGLPPLFVSVNVSAVQFSKKILAESIANALEKTNLSPGSLQLELTESVIVENTNESGVILNELKELGLSLCVDDFGTGYSSLAYLKSFPVHALKVPRCFVRDLTTDLNDAAIVSATVALAHNLGLRVIAEGIEHRDQHLILKSQGCEQAQGFLFCRPLPAQALADWVQRGADLPQQQPSNVVPGNTDCRLSA